MSDYETEMKAKRDVGRIADAMESIARDTRDIREFLLGTTLRDLDKETKSLRKESREANEERQSAPGSV